MSKILGRAIDVLGTINYIQETDIPKYRRDNNVSSWSIVEDVPNKLKIYLPESAIDFINKEEISIVKSPFRKYTLTSVPTYPDEKRFIRFPSKIQRMSLKENMLSILDVFFQVIKLILKKNCLKWEMNMMIYFLF